MLSEKFKDAGKIQTHLVCLGLQFLIKFSRCEQQMEWHEGIFCTYRLVPVWIDTEWQTVLQILFVTQKEEEEKDDLMFLPLLRCTANGSWSCCTRYSAGCPWRQWLTRECWFSTEGSQTAQTSASSPGWTDTKWGQNIWQWSTHRCGSKHFEHIRSNRHTVEWEWINICMLTYYLRLSYFHFLMKMLLYWDSNSPCRLERWLMVLWSITHFSAVSS